MAHVFGFRWYCSKAVLCVAVMAFLDGAVPSALAQRGGGIDNPPPSAFALAPRAPGPGGQGQMVQATLDGQLRALIRRHGITGDPARGRNIPAIDDPVAQLGLQLFFSKSLGGGFDSACVSCHHPVLGGADALSLSVGVAAVEPALLGEGRVHVDGIPLVPRNAPTVFNVALWDTGLFWDSRVVVVGRRRGTGDGRLLIRTPDSEFGVADPAAGDELVAAQARFPVTSVEEMKTDAFEDGSDNEAIRGHLAARLGNYGVGEGELGPNRWIDEFRDAFDSLAPAQELVSYDNIARALSAYQRSMVFTDTPWKAYVEGDDSALTNAQKRGAILFYSSADDGGADCVQCHSGDLFTDGSHQAVAFPQIGPGKGDGRNDDFGRERETGERDDRYRFRVPSLLNVAVTAPYGHAGVYESLQQVVRHYDRPRATVNNFFAEGGWCQLAQFETIEACESLYPDARRNSNRALAKLRQERNAGDSRLANFNLNNRERNQLVRFMEALTDPCVLDRDCLAPWIADTTSGGPDGQQLNATDRFSDPL